MKKLLVILFALIITVLPISVSSLSLPVYHEYSEDRNYSMFPAAEFKGTGQGSAVFENTMFICDNSGNCRMIDLNDGTLIAVFRLGSYNSGTVPKGERGNGTSKEHWANHSNQIMFGASKFRDSDPFPLLYVTTGNSGNHDGTGAYIAKCAIERILYSETDRKWYAQTVQIIEFNDHGNIPEQTGNPRKNMNGDNGASELTDMFDKESGSFRYISGNGYSADAGYQKIGWGWPAAFVDSSPTEKTEGKFYLFSARFRTTSTYEKINRKAYGGESADWNYYGDSVNAYIITEFDLPELPESEDSKDYGGYVTLYPKDITDQFTTEYSVGVTQGGTMYRGKIYYSFGFGKTRDNIYSRNAIQVFDIAEKKISAFLPIYTHDSYLYEPECTSIFNGELLLGMNGNGNYCIYGFGYVSDEAESIAASCEQPGKELIRCSLCESLLNSAVTSPKLGHETELREYREPTENSEGIKAHYCCKLCGTLFSDAEASIKITEKDTVIPRIPTPGERPQSRSGILMIVAAAAILSVALVGFFLIRKLKK